MPLSRSSGPCGASARFLRRVDLQGKNDELVKELVALSTKHGVLTPYTTFLADENARTDLASHAVEARRRLESLGEVTGDRGVSLRLNRNYYERAALPNRKTRCNRRSAACTTRPNWPNGFPPRQRHLARPTAAAGSPAAASASATAELVAEFPPT